MYQFTFQNKTIQVVDSETNSVVLHQPFNPFNSKAEWANEQEALQWLGSAYPQFLPENNQPVDEDQIVDVPAEDITPQE